MLWHSTPSERGGCIGWLLLALFGWAVLLLGIRSCQEARLYALPPPGAVEDEWEQWFLDPEGTVLDRLELIDQDQREAHHPDR